MSLQLENIAVEYGQAPRVQRAVDGVSLDLPTGEIGALIGPSGCGKSSLLRAVAGLQAISTGSIHAGGQLLSKPSYNLAPEVRGVGMVFQDYALFPHMSVARNIAFGLAQLPRPAQQARIAEVLDLVGLADLAQRMPHELSGGQQQRVALARALARKPAVLLLDEPFSSLDAAMREKLAQEVRSILKAAGSTALVVTHDQHEAFAMADRIGVMQAGQLQQWDSPYNIYHQPATRFVAEFVGDAVLLPVQFQAGGQATAQAGSLLQTPLGELALSPEQSAGHAPGAALHLLLRADELVIDNASPLQATVTQVQFRGSLQLCTLQLPSGHSVLLQSSSISPLTIGQNLQIAARLNSVVLFAV
ncbi:MAG: ABC transporter ATP-binding protein [Brachymonas sp.]